MKSSTYIIRRSIGHGILYVIVAFTLVTMVFPLLWMVSTSFKTYETALDFPPRMIPEFLNWKSYTNVLSTTHLPLYFRNTAIYAVVGTVLEVILAVLGGFAFAKYRFPGSGVLFSVILATMMIPGQVTLIPVFLILKRLRWLDSFLALIVPGIASPFGIFLIRQFGRGIPDELMEAARIDGCPEVRILTQVFVPLCLPAITTLAVLAFMGRWNDLFWPLIVTTSENMQTLQLQLTKISRTLYDTIWNELMAGMTMACLPIIAVYIAFQRYFTQGIVLTGLKG
jgi:ABC-type glycerol-3-phosphate transport system permease component